MKKRAIKFIGTVLAATISTGVSYAQNTEDLLELDLASLMNIQITSVSKKAERLQDVPSSIYVITSQDIERSSAQNLMQLLRDNVPGFWAAANDYRNVDAFMRNTDEGSVLFLLDGTPINDLTSFNLDYESIDIPFEQIERIEVIKGSGGTVYGANSATGVVSIITKQAHDQKKLVASADYALPGQTKVSVIATPIKNDKLATSVYAKYTMFDGFNQKAEMRNATSIVPKQEFNAGDTLINNRFMGDDNSVKIINAGFNINYKPNDALKISSALNYTSYNSELYYQSYPTATSTFLPVGKPSTRDTVYLKSNQKNKLTANVKADYSFSEKHNLFARVSTNMDDRTYYLAGGYDGNNNIYDIEIQDNIDFGFNSLSFGGNYRMVNYDIQTNNMSTIRFIDPQSKENLKGFFVQDKLSLLNGKLNLYLGAKAENFTLVDDNYYLSPMAKFAFMPQENITFWGGYSQSYTTPGFNHTNIEMDLFTVSSPHALYNSLDPSGAMAGGYDAIRAGLVTGTPESHETAAKMVAAGAGSDSALVADMTVEFPETYRISVVNGPKTTPTSFENYELGFRIQPTASLSFESNYFFTKMKDGVGSSPKQMGIEDSRTIEGQKIASYYYGNYFKGTNQGLESVLKLKASDDLMIELSHAWYRYTLEYQNNDDFDITTLSDNQKKLKNEDYPQLPEHTFRWKIYYDINKSLKFTLSSIHSSSYFAKFGVVESTYSYQNQRFDPLYGDGGNQVLLGGKKNSRTIFNLRLDKYMLNNQLNLFVYATDFLNADTFVEGINQLESSYPRQVGGFLGAGLTYRIN